MRLARYALAVAFAALPAGCAISTQQELALGAEYATQLDKELPIVRDQRILTDLDAIAARLVPFSTRPEVRYRFFLVNLDVVNAFAVPGGYIYVTRGIVEKMTSMDQLAGVLGHEMGHVEYRHSAKQIGRTQWAQVGVAATGAVVGGQAGQVAQQGAGVAATLALQSYSRDQERESDRFAVDVTTRAGINPGGIVSFFETLRQVEGARTSDLEYFFSSHPLTDDRIRDVNALIQAQPAAVAALGTGQRSAPEFDRLKAAVRLLPVPRDRQRAAAPK
jgi:predicted Zn-dependent protease